MNPSSDDHTASHAAHASSSRKRYEVFRKAFREGRLSQFTHHHYEEAELPAPPEGRKTRQRKYLRQYTDWIWRFRRSALMVLAIAVAVAALETIQPLFMRYIVDQVLLNTDLDTPQRLSRLHLAGISLFGVVIVAQLLGALKNFRQRQLNVRVIMSLRQALYDRLLRLPLQKLSDMKTGGIISRLSDDVTTTTGLLQMAVVSPGVSAIRLLVAIGILLYLNWKLSLTAISIIPGIVLISFSVARRIRPIYRSIRKDNSEVDGRVSETFSGIRVVRAFQREGTETAEYVVGRNTIIRKELLAHRRELVLWTTWGFLIAAVNVVIMWFGGYLSIQGGASIGDIMAFQWYTLLLLNPVWQIVNSFSELQRSLAAMERIFEVLEMPEDKPDRPHARPAPRIVDSLHFEEVSFEYVEGRPVLEAIDVEVPGGTVVALVGRSGAGKTTFTDLVARFFDPTSGRITLNGTDIRDFRLSSYRELLAVVQQDVFLFDGTVSQNIAYGRHQAAQAEIEEAARRANADEFIRRLPEGYDSLIGERGVKLSGGQCQRISIARAILADPQILILDEATSSLDTESEQLIQQSLAALLKGRTTFVIAHRLSTITRADLILVLHQGKIIERGTHESLMAAQGDYQQMVVRQQEAMAESAANVN